MRRFSRKKEAPIELKKQIKILIKLENKFKLFFAYYIKNIRLIDNI